MTRITAAAPEALIYASNQLAMCLAFSIADGLTYTGLNWQDSTGNLYAAASWEASDAWVEGATQPLVRPAWDVDEVIDMPAAEAAQAVLMFSTEPVLAVPDKLTALSGPDAVAALMFSTEPVLAVPDKLTALSGPDAVAALGLMGLVPVAPDETP